jgi:hypothetical protein
MDFLGAGRRRARGIEGEKRLMREKLRKGEKWLEKRYGTLANSVFFFFFF